MNGKSLLGIPYTRNTHVSMTVKICLFSARNRSMFLLWSIIWLHVIMPYWQNDYYFTEVSPCVASESVLFVNKKIYHLYDCSSVMISVFVCGL